MRTSQATLLKHISADYSNGQSKGYFRLSVYNKENNMSIVQMNEMPKCHVETTILFLNYRNSIMILGYVLLDVSESGELNNMTAISDKEYRKAISLLTARNSIFTDENGKIIPAKIGKSLERIIAEMANWGEQYKAQQLKQTTVPHI